MILYFSATGNSLAVARQLAERLNEQLMPLIEAVRQDLTNEKRIGCGRCYVSCADGGHQAIAFDEERKPKILGTKCVGCHLCRLVCPTGAIGIAKRINKTTM